MTTGTRIVGSGTTPFYLEKSWSGEDDPEFHQRENAYVMNLTERKAFGAVEYCNQWGCTQCIPQPDLQLTAPNLLLSSIDEVNEMFSEARRKAQQRLVDPIRNHDLDLGNYIPEGRQTAALVGSALNRIKNTAKALRRGDVDMAVRAMAGGKPSGRYTNAAQKLNTRDVSSAHLAMVYGIMPLLSDIFESAQAWEAVTAPPRAWVVNSSGSSKRDLSKWTDLAFYKFKTSAKVRVEYKVYMREQLSVPRSLGLYDPLGMLWEGTKLSFVVDWFFPIGNYLDTLNILPWIEADVFSSTKYLQRSLLVGPGKYPWGCTPWSTGENLANYQSHTKHIRLQRGPDSFTSGSIERPTFKPIKSALSGAHLANAAALIHQMLPKMWR
jgi:hypothetical protein